MAQLSDCGTTLKIFFTAELADKDIQTVSTLDLQQYTRKLVSNEIVTKEGFCIKQFSKVLQDVQNDTADNETADWNNRERFLGKKGTVYTIPFRKKKAGNA